MSYAWLIVGAFHISMATGYGVQGSFGVFVTSFSEEMNWSRTAISGAASTLMFMHFLMAGVWGLAAERWGIRWVVAISGVLFGLAVFLTSTAQSLWQLYLYWGIVGSVGLGGFASSMAGLATRWIEHRRVLALGIGWAGIGVGLASLPLLTEWLISIGDWRLGFRTLSFIAWGMFLLMAIVVREPSGRTASADRGAVSNDPDCDIHSAQGFRSHSGIRSGFGRMVDVTLSESIRTRNFWLLFGMQLIVAVIIQTTLLHIVPRAEDAGIESSRAASLLMVIGVCSILGKVCGGFLGDRFGPRQVFIIAMAATILVMVWLIQSNALWMFYLFAATYGIVYGIWVPQLSGMTVRLFGTGHMGAIFGGMLVGAGIGAVIGPTTAGYVFDTTGSYFIAFVMTASVAVVGAVLAILLKKEAGTV